MIAARELIAVTGSPSSRNSEGGSGGCLVQLTRLTCTFASPGHFCEDTASVITPPWPVRYSRLSERARFWDDRVRADQARALAGSQMIVGSPEPVDAVVLDPHLEGVA